MDHTNRPDQVILMADNTIPPVTPTPVPVTAEPAVYSVYDAHRRAKAVNQVFSKDPDFTSDQQAGFDALATGPTNPRLSFAERRAIVNDRGNKTITETEFKENLNATHKQANVAVAELRDNGVDPDITAHKPITREIVNGSINFKDGKVETAKIDGVGKRVHNSLVADVDKPYKETMANAVKTVTNGIKAHSRVATNAISSFAMKRSNVTLVAAAALTAFGLFKTITSPFKGKTVDEEGNVKEPTLLRKTVNTVMSAALMVGGAVLARQALGGAVGQGETMGKFTSMIDKSVNRGNWMGGSGFMR